MHERKLSEPENHERQEIRALYHDIGGEPRCPQEARMRVGEVDEPRRKHQSGYRHENVGNHLTPQGRGTLFSPCPVPVDEVRWYRAGERCRDGSVLGVLQPQNRKDEE